MGGSVVPGTHREHRRRRPVRSSPKAARSPMSLHRGFAARPLRRTARRSSSQGRWDGCDVRLRPAAHQARQRVRASAGGGGRGLPGRARRRPMNAAVGYGALAVRRGRRGARHRAARARVAARRSRGCCAWVGDTSSSRSRPPSSRSRRWSAALFAHDFSIEYVADNVARATPGLYTFTAAWAALEGSILLWVLALTGYLAVTAWRFRARTD